MADKPILQLNNAAALRLAQLISMGGLLTAPDQLYAIGAFAEDHLTDLAASPLHPDNQAPIADRLAWEKRFIAWGREPIAPIETTIKRRGALKALLKSAADKAQLSGSAGDRTLLKVLELAGDE